MRVAYVDCLSWSRGTCRELRFGGRPSPEDCERRCDGRKPRMDGPAVRWIDVPDAEPAPVDAGPEVAPENPATWDELHTRALRYTGDTTYERDWLIDFAQRVPTRGCVCRSDWALWTKQHRPDLSSAAAYFAWTVEAHNAVNARLGKPQFDLEAARARWSR